MTLQDIPLEDTTASAGVDPRRPDNDTVPGLTRAVLIDSISPGRIAELPLDGHCLVTGSNAAGKTSLIQLVPLFTGVSPNQISKKADGKAFIPYYLPRTTSYIAFEYAHRGGQPRSVIVHASTAGNDLRYRFVRSALFQNMFIGDDGGLVEARDLARHMKERGYEVVDRAIDTLRDYRSILQGLKTTEAAPDRRRFMVQTTNDYAMAHPAHPLRNIDRVVAAMLKKDGSLRALEEMIAGKVLGDVRKVRVSGDHKRLTNWPDQFRAYLEVMRHAPKARQLSSSKIELDRLNSDIADTFDEMRAIHDRDTQDKARLEKTVALHHATRDLEREAFDEKTQALHQKVSDAETALDIVKSRIGKIDRQKREGERADIAASVQLAASEASLKRQREALQTEITAITGKQRDIEEKFSRLKHDVRENYNRDRDLVDQRISARRQAFDSEAINLGEIHERRREAVEAQHEEVLATLRAAIETAAHDHGTAKQRAENPIVPQGIIDARDAAQRIADDRATDYQDALVAKGTLDEASREAQADYDRIEGEIRKLRRKVDEARARRAEVEAQKKPPAGSLLEYLRSDAPDWGDDIARSIRPDLLTRTDLDPAMGQGDGTLFGLSLDLSGVDPHPSAETATLDARIEAITDEIDQLEEEVRQTAKAQAATARARTDAMRATEENDAALRTGRSKLEAAQKIVAQRNSDIAAARATALHLAREDLERCAATLGDARTALSHAEQSRTGDLESQRKANAIEFGEAKARLGSDIEALKAEQTDLRAQRDKRIGELDETLRQHLSNAGIDTDHLGKLKASLDEVQGKITSIENNAARVAEWLRFMKDDLPRLPGLHDEQRDRQKAVDATRQEKTHLAEAWRARSNALGYQIKEGQDRIAALEADIKNAAGRLEQSEGYPRRKDRGIVRTLDEVIRDLNAQQGRKRTLNDDIEKGVQSLAAVFRKVSNSPPDQYLTQEMQHLPTKTGADWIAPIINWFDQAHEAYRDTLMTEARVMTNDITSTYHRLDRLESSISAENRRLQGSLARNNRLDVVSDIGVTIKSSIQELDFLPAMRRLARLHEQWENSGESLPPEDFVKAMEEMLVFWRADGISANLESHIKIVGHVVENGNRRDFASTTNLSDISSNGVSYLILTIILVGFLNMIRGESRRVQIVWALDELSNIDATNTRRLLDMLRENDITLVAATPSSEAEVRRHFDYQMKLVKTMNEPRLAYVAGSNARPIGLDWSPAQAAHPNFQNTSTGET